MALRKRETAWTGEERRRPPTVLVVTDDDGARELLVKFLAQAGFDADGARGADTLVKMNEHLPRCVVLDMASGGVGSSLKVLDQIRTHDDRRINTSRVVLCAPSPKNRTFSFQSGADAFVVRPFHINDLIAHIVDVIDRPQDERARHRRDQLTQHP